MVKVELWSAVARERDGAGVVGLGGGKVDADAKLQMSIDSLTQAIKELRQEIGIIRENMRTDFARFVDRQGSQFRWLVGLLVASAIALASMIYKTGHP